MIREGLNCLYEMHARKLAYCIQDMLRHAHIIALASFDRAAICKSLGGTRASGDISTIG